jgi:hypothetical protein
VALGTRSRSAVNLKEAAKPLIEERIASMQTVRKLVRRLKELGQEVDKAPALEEGVRQLRKFREEFLRGWPSRVPPSPVDREAIAKAREAMRGGAKGMTKHQLVWGHKLSEEV